MTNKVSNPQPSGSPLNLKYKGVFSTRIGSNNISKFGQYLDKLYQVKFLGIGTHEGTITVPDALIGAVVLRLTSINGKVEFFRSIQERTHYESFVPEELGGIEIRKDVELLQDVTAIEGDNTRSAEYLSSLYGDKLANAVEEGYLPTAQQIRQFDQLIDNLAQEVLRQVRVTDTTLSKRLHDLNKGTTDDRDEQSNREVREALTQFVNQLFDKELGQALEQSEIHQYGKELVGLTEDFSKDYMKSDITSDQLEGSGYDLVRSFLLEQLEKFRDITEKNAEIDEHIQLDKRIDGEVGSSVDMDNAGVNEFALEEPEQFRKVEISKAETELAANNLLTEKKSYASIDYNHELLAEDSKNFQAVLDAIRDGFNDLLFDGPSLQAELDELVQSRSDSAGIGLITALGDGSGKTADEVMITDSKSGIDSGREGRVKEDVSPALRLHIPGSETKVEMKYELGSIAPWKGSILETNDGEFAPNEEPLLYTPPDEFHAEWSENKEPILPTFGTELFAAEISNPDQPLTVFSQDDFWGEYSGDSINLLPDMLVDIWGEMTSPENTQVYAPDPEALWGDFSSNVLLQPDQSIEVTGTITSEESVFTQYDDENYEIAVLGCSDNQLTFRRRPDLKPDPKPEDPLFEWVCTEGYVCDDWLIVPLKDFNFEHPDMEGFYDPITFKPYYPTGQTDENGDPYVLPPYSTLNEPISNGVEVGGREPMAIDPCNLYSFIEYIVKIYDAHKSRFRASTPIDTISRVMNMVYEQVLKLISEWDESKSYGIDELWRIYRFIRWMALGITNRFYRLKLVYTYGDFAEQFEVSPISELIQTEGSSRKFIQTYGNVLEGHPLLASIENKASIEFNVPLKTRSTTISFELGNNTPDRPDNVEVGGVLFYEDFQGDPSSFKIKGEGWVPVITQGGTSLAVEDPASAKTYRTTNFIVPDNVVNAHIKFNYGFDTNLETKLVLKKSNGVEIWASAASADYSFVDLNVGPGSYYFEVRVPQKEVTGTSELTFTADKIQNDWTKSGYQTKWEVKGNTIYEEENTPSLAMVINQQWKKDTEYKLEGEFMTSGGPTGLEDWIGFIFNYKDSSNYYAVGSYGSTSPGIQSGFYSGIWKVTNGSGHPYENVPPTWKISNGNFKWNFNVWYKMRVEVDGNSFKVFLGETGSTLRQVLTATDTSGWGYGSSGLAAYSNPFSTFRNMKYHSQPRFNAFIDNVVVSAEHIKTPVKKPKYLIDFYLEDENRPRIANYSADGKRGYSFPILVGEHKARWVFKKQGEERSIAQDASFIDNLVIRGIKPVSVKVEEEIIGCGGHMAVKLLIENLLEYYRRHHQGCKGDRNIWIIE